MIKLGLGEIQPGLVLNFFLIFGKNPGLGSYKLGSYKKKRVHRCTDVPHSQSHTPWKLGPLSPVSPL